jgi:arabinogalactan oligomer / maltooligosaccharide transport system permease protein
MDGRVGLQYSSRLSTKKSHVRMRRQDRLTLWGNRVIVWILLILVLFPVLWVIEASFAPGNSFFSDSLFPGSFTLQNYKDVFQTTDFLLWLRNSLLVCTTVAILQVLLTSTSSYAFSRLRFFGRKYGLVTLLILQMFPNFMAVAAIFGMLSKFNMLDNLWAYILVLTGGSAYNVWLLKGYMDTIPKALDEAAIVDGANTIQVFWRIILPLSAPMLTVIFLFTFIGNYSEFILSSALLQDQSNFTIAIGLQQFIKDQFAKNWTQFSAAAIMASLPLVIITMLVQRWIAGIVAGAVKE